MNPEEGELRPQLLDRFGLTVEAAAPRDPASRAEVVRRRIAFDADPAAFARGSPAAEASLAAAIAAARQRLPAVVLDDPALERIAGVCASFDVDGLRADIVIARAAAAHAAWRGGLEVSREDIRVASLLALPHRRRRNPFDAPGLDEQQLDDALGEPGDEPEPDPPGGGRDRRRPDDGPEDGPEDGRTRKPAIGRPPDGDGGRRDEPGRAATGGARVGRAGRRDVPRAAARGAGQGAGRRGPPVARGDGRRPERGRPPAAAGVADA